MKKVILASVALLAAMSVQAQSKVYMTREKIGRAHV